MSPQEFDDLDVVDLFDLLDAYGAASQPQPGPRSMSKGQRDRAIDELMRRAEAQKQRG